MVDDILSLMVIGDALQVEQHLVDFEGHLKACIKKLEKMSNTIGLVCLFGMAGVGKKSLAK